MLHELLALLELCVELWRLKVKSLPEEAKKSYSYSCDTVALGRVKKQKVGTYRYAVAYGIKRKDLLSKFFKDQLKE